MWEKSASIRSRGPCTRSWSKVNNGPKYCRLVILLYGGPKKHSNLFCGNSGRLFLLNIGPSIICAHLGNFGGKDSRWRCRNSRIFHPNWLRHSCTRRWRTDQVRQQWADHHEECTKGAQSNFTISFQSTNISIFNFFLVLCRKREHTILFRGE